MVRLSEDTVKVPPMMLESSNKDISNESFCVAISTSMSFDKIFKVLLPESSVIVTTSLIAIGAVFTCGFTVITTSATPEVFTPSVTLNENVSVPVKSVFGVYDVKAVLPFRLVIPDMVPKAGVPGTGINVKASPSGSNPVNVN